MLSALASSAVRGLRTTGARWVRPTLLARAFATPSSGAEGEVLCALRRVGKTLPGGRKLFSDVQLDFFAGAKIGVLGLNGSGKSSLLKILAGMDREFDGERWVRDGIKVGYLAQEPYLDPSKTVHENVLDGVEHKLSLVRRFNEISAKMAEPDADMDALLQEQGELMEKIELLGCWETEREVQMAMEALRCAPPEWSVTNLSGGERRRVALARLLLSAPDMLLLDEPTNHLDAESVSWLEQYLHNYKGLVMAVTHDRYFLDNVAGWILELDAGMAIPYQGNYSTWLEKKQQRLGEEKKQDLAKRRALERELEWIRKNPKAGRGKSKARVKTVAKLQQDVRSGSMKDRVMGGAIVIPPGPRLGNVVCDLKNLTMAVDGKLLFENFSFSLAPGARVGVVGGNGTGKTTLFRIIAGELKPLKGTVSMGSTVSLGIVSQSRDTLDPDKTVYQEISQGADEMEINGERISLRVYTAAFNLRGAAQEKKVAALSGGERNRVHLAKTLRQEVNVLLLDEPTNDLDVETLRALEEALRDFPGSVMVISHDRWFLDRLCNETIAFEGDSKVEHYPGPYSDYELDHVRRAGLEAHPARTKYRPLAAEVS